VALFKIRVVKPDPGAEPGPGGIQLNLRTTEPTTEPTGLDQPAVDPATPDQPVYQFQGTPGQFFARTFEDSGWRPGSVPWYLLANRNRFITGWLLVLTALFAFALLAGPVSQMHLPTTYRLVTFGLTIVGWAGAVMYYRSALADAKAARVLSRRTAAWIGLEALTVVGTIANWLLVARG